MYLVADALPKQLCKMRITRTYFAFILLTSVSCNKSKTEESKVTEIKAKTKSASPTDLFEISRPSLWVYGGPPSPRDHQRQIVDDLYHFRFDIKSSSCTVTPEIGTDKHNQITDSIMTVRLGRDWQQRFEHSVDSLYTLDSLAIAIAKKDKYILKLEKTAGMHNDKYDFYPGLEYTAYATSDDNLKIVTINGLGVVKSRVKMLNYIRVTIDIRKRKAIFTDKTAFVIY